MQNFQPGQKLTASELNNVLAYASGPANPTSSWKWMQTSNGKLETSWSNFTNSEWQDSDMFTIRVSPSTDAPDNFTINGQKAYALRRVFMYVGSASLGRLTYADVANTTMNSLFNGTAYITVLGWQYLDQQSPLHGDNSIRWSLFNATKRPEGDDAKDPTKWITAQNLFAKDASRSDSMTGWWWTGVTLEDVGAPEIDIGCNIVAYPVFVYGRSTEQGAMGFTQKFPILVVCTYDDYMSHREDLQEEVLDNAAFKQELASMLNTMYKFSLDRVEHEFNQNFAKLLATYEYKTDSLDAHYRQCTNDVTFDNLYGGCIPIGTSYSAANAAYDVGTLQYVIDNEHHTWTPSASIPVCDAYTGEPLYSTEGSYSSPCPVALVLATNGINVTPALLCCNIEVSADVYESFLSSCLSADEQLSSWDKRLVWIDRCDSRGIEWYDRCPRFGGGGGSLYLSAWDGLSTHSVHVNGDVSIVLSSRSDSDVEADLNMLSSGQVVVNIGVYYV